MLLMKRYAKITIKYIMMENVFVMRVRGIIQLILNHQKMNVIKKMIYLKIFI